MLQLIIRDIFELPSLKQVISAAKEITAFFSHSAQAAQLLKDKQRIALDNGVAEEGLSSPLLLVTHSETRWNSLHDLFERLHKLSRYVNEVLRDKKRDDLLLPDSYVEVLQLLVSQLKPWKDLTVAFSSSSSVTISAIWPTVSCILDEFEWDISRDILPCSSPVLLASTSTVSALAEELLALHRIPAAAEIGIPSAEAASKEVASCAVDMANVPVRPHSPVITGQQKNQRRQELTAAEKASAESDISIVLAESMKARFKEFLEHQLPLLQAATALDIRYHTNGFSDGDCEKVHENLVRLAEHNFSVFERISKTKTSALPQTPVVKHADDSLLSAIAARMKAKNSSLQRRSMENVETVRSKVSEEWKTYARMESILNADPLAWWRDHSQTFPVLAFLARILLSIQAASVSSERLWSDAGLILTDMRSSLSDENFSQLLFLRQHVSRRLHSQFQELKIIRQELELGIDSRNQQQAWKKARLTQAREAFNKHGPAGGMS